MSARSIFDMCIISLPSKILYIFLIYAVVEVISVNNNYYYLRTEVKQPADRYGKIFPLSFDTNSQPLAQCKCTSSSECPPENIIYSNERFCGDYICCKEPQINNALEYCRCMKKGTCQKSQSTAGQVPLSKRAQSKKPNCKLPDTECCEIPYAPAERASFPTAPSPLVPPKIITKTTKPPLSYSIRLASNNPNSYVSVSPRYSTDDGQTAAGEFPWVVLVLQIKEPDNEYEERCAGSLLSSNIILTVAHCLKDIPNSELVIRAGEYDPTNSLHDYGIQDRRVSRVTRHPKHNPLSLLYDFALILVDRSFTNTDNVAPILWDDSVQSSEYDRSKCVAAGWGTGWGKRKLSELNKLRKANMNVISNEDCGRQYRVKGNLSKFFELHDSFICAEGLKKYETCDIDGGTPLVCALSENPSQYIQVGLLSWDLGCTRKDLPSTFASLSPVMKWLSSEYDIFNINY